MHVAFVGGEAVERNRPERRIAGRLEDDRLAAVIEPEPAPIAADMRAEEPRLAPERDELAPQLLGRPVRVCRGSLSKGRILSRTKRSVRSFSSTKFVGERKIHRHLRNGSSHAFARFLHPASSQLRQAKLRL